MTTLPTNPRGAQTQRLFLISVLSVSLWFVAASAAAQPIPGLTGAAQLARAYDAIFDARFERVPAILAQTCPPAPREACQLLEVLSLWWQIQLDPSNRARDPLFQVRVDAVITAAEKWTEREPHRAEAWFYLGGAYGARVQWQVLRGNQVAAARDGKRIKDALEHAIALDANLQDAYFGIGLYHYYADVASPGARLLRWLLLLPGGDRELGMEEMQRTRTGGQLLRGEADYQMHVLYLWYEKQPERALELLRDLRDRYPHNPLFLQLIAGIEDTYVHDPTASLRRYDALLGLAESGSVAEPRVTAAAAHIGAARQLEQLYETDAAIVHLRAVIDADPSPGPAAVADAQRLLVRAQQRLADPAYRLSLEGWRSLERGDIADASRAMTRAMELDPDDPVIRYRYARLLFAQKRDDDALVVLADVHKRGDTAPPTFFSLACVDAARVKERAGDVHTAIELYRSASSVFGGDRRVKSDAERQLARLLASSR